jgi:DNA-binding transcriptional ArsR family regulator
MNIKLSNHKTQQRRLARLLRTIGQPTRLKILLALGAGEACVCHLESLLGMRQAYISQHLMALRRAGVVRDRREGRFVFYRLNSPQVLELIELAGRVVGVSSTDLFAGIQTGEPSLCSCPNCVPDTN